MSLINNMLKDLEYRERQHPNLTYLPYNRSIRKKWVMSVILKIALGISCFVLVMLTAYFLFFKHQIISSIPFIKEAPIKNTVASTVNTDWRLQTNITGITVQNKDNITELTFLLDKSALYRLVSDESDNQLIVYIDRAKLKSELPPANFMGKAISKIASVEVDEATKFIISFTPGSTLKYVNQNTVNGHPELVISIREAILNEPREQQNTFSEVNNLTNNNTVKAPTTENMLNQQYQAALINAEHGNYSLAVQNLTALLKMDPEYRDARVSLIALLIDRGQVHEAEELVKIGVMQSPDFIPFIELKARVYAMEGKYKQALNVLLSHAPSMDENPEYHSFIAAMYHQNNQYKLAVTIYQHLLSLNEKNSSWWFGLGVSLDKLNDKKNALLAFKNAAKNGNLNQESRTYLQERLHQLQEATDDKE